MLQTSTIFIYKITQISIAQCMPSIISKINLNRSYYYSDGVLNKKKKKKKKAMNDHGFLKIEALAM